MRIILILILGCMSLGSLKAQCECEENKKRDKLIEQSASKKYDLYERIAKLEEAIELDEECMEPRVLLAKLTYVNADKTGAEGALLAATYFEEMQERCPSYDAEALYLLGLYYYNEERWKDSETALMAFINFPQDDPSKLGGQYEEYLVDAETMRDNCRASSELFQNQVPFDPVKVAGVCSFGDEYLPTLSPDNQTLFYTRKYDKKAKGDLYARKVEEFTASERSSLAGEFDGGKALPTPFNLGDNYGGTSISVNNKEMYVTVCRPDKRGYNNCDIYVSKFTKSKDPATGKDIYAWGELENLGPEVNSPLWDAQPSLSADGNTLYFATLREGTTPEAAGDPSMDIYYSNRRSDGTWTKALSIGDVINTSGHEKSPFMHGDSRTLYFSCQGRRGAGGYDIFYTRMLEDGVSWTEPKNIGIPINTEDDEHGLIVSTDGTEAYYASKYFGDAQGFDIYRFEVPEQAKPEKVVLVRGEVKDEEGEIVRDAEINLHFVESKRVEHIEIDREDGTYATIINVDTEPVVMTIEKEGHAFQAQLYTAESAADVIVERSIEIKAVAVGKPYTIDDINYATNSAEINESSKLVLDQFASYLQKQPKLRIAIHGHTDNVGNSADNQTLSTERAFEVMNYLQYKGVPVSALSFKGYGASTPIADNNTEEGKAENRRTEFVITGL